MSNASDYFEEAILNTMRGSNITAFTPYVALFNGDPTDAGTGGTEVTETIRGDGRVAATFGAPSGGSMSNSAEVDFGDAEAGATVDYFAIFDAATDGNMIAHGSLTPQVISAGNPVSFPAGNLTITVA